MEELFEMRLRINDPADIIAIEAVDSLPASPVAQTAYRLSTNGTYNTNDGTSWSVLELELSDARILSTIDSLGDAAECRLLSYITRKLGSKLFLVKNTSGADSTEYVKVLDLYNYYKQLMADCKAERKSDLGKNTGRVGKISTPTIAGGNL
jgi:hypothetical protein